VKTDEVNQHVPPPNLWDAVLRIQSRGKVLYKETNPAMGPTAYREHVYAFGDLFACMDGVVRNPNSRVVHYYHTDAQESVESITNGAGTVVWRFAYTAFGRVTSEQGMFDAVPILRGRSLTKT
jgi:YD repeat-containing protein